MTISASPIYTRNPFNRFRLTALRYHVLAQEALRAMYVASSRLEGLKNDEEHKPPRRAMWLDIDCKLQASKLRDAA